MNYKLERLKSSLKSSKSPYYEKRRETLSRTNIVRNVNMSDSVHTAYYYGHCSYTILLGSEISYDWIRFAYFQADTSRHICDPLHIL